MLKISPIILFCNAKKSCLLFLLIHPLFSQHIDYSPLKEQLSFVKLMFLHGPVKFVPADLQKWPSVVN